MKFSYSWLNEYIDIEKDSDFISSNLTNLGLEIEKKISTKEALNDFLVCEILKISKHPNADRLKICEVGVGEKKTYKVICGASNANKGLKTVFAPNGTYIPGKMFTLEKKNIRGETGEGMLCSAEELGLTNNEDGIIELTNKYKVGEKFNKYLEGDDIYEVGLTPNRGDCASVKGIARELSAKLNITLKERDTYIEENSFKSTINWKINNEVIKGYCPVIYGRYFKIEENKKSPRWLNEKILSVGLNPISTLVDITNFILYDLGRPLHVFDANKINGNPEVRFAVEGEEFLGLDKRNYKLTKHDLIISDNEKVLSLAGIMGGLHSAVDENTKDVFLEVAYFDPDTITKSGRRLSIMTDSRYRFERGVDKHGLKEGLNFATKLIHENCGGTYSEIVKTGEELSENKKIEYYFESFNKIMGYNLDTNKQAEYLTRLKFKTYNLEKTKMNVVPPTWRHDISNEHDIIEEIARLNGYDKIPYKKSLNKISSSNKRFSEIDNLKIDMREKFAFMGFHEIISYTFIAENKIIPNSEYNTELKLSNPISTEMEVMRNSLYPNLLDVVHKNYVRGINSISLFEVGSVFRGIKEEEQLENLAFVRSGIAEQKSWHKGNREFDFFDIKRDVSQALSFFKMNEFTDFQRSNEEWYHPGKSADIIYKKNKIGSFGELHPELFSLFKIKKPTFIAMIDLSNLIFLGIEKKLRKDFIHSPFLTLKKDFSFLMSTDQSVKNLKKVVRETSDLIGNIIVFDVYKSEKQNEDTISVSIEVEILQIEKVFNAEEINDLMTKIITNVDNQLGIKLRS